MKKILTFLAASAAMLMLALPANAGGGSKGGMGGSKGGSISHSFHMSGGSKGGMGGNKGGSTPSNFHTMGGTKMGGNSGSGGNAGSGGNCGSGPCGSGGGSGSGSGSGSGGGNYHHMKMGNTKPGSQQKQQQTQSQQQNATANANASATGCNGCSPIATAYGGTVSGSGNSTNALTNAGNSSVYIQAASSNDLSSMLVVAPIMLFAVLPGLNNQPQPAPCPGYMMPMPDGRCQPPVVLHTRG